MRTPEVVYPAENECYKDGEEAVKDCPNRFCVRKAESAKREKKDI